MASVGTVTVHVKCGQAARMMIQCMRLCAMRDGFWAGVVVGLTVGSSWLLLEVI